MSAYVLAIDEGGTGVRAHLFDHEGHEVAASYAEIGLAYPRPGWVEHDPLALWERTLAVTQATLTKAGVGAGDVCALGIANQRASAVVWDADSGMPVYPAIGWQDLRTVARCEELGRRGHTVSPLHSATKLAWILDTVAGARARAAAGRLRFGTIDTWIAWRLSAGGTYVTDPSNASCTGLYDFLSTTSDCRSGAFRRSCRPAPAPARPPPISSGPPCRSPPALAISKQRCSASSAPSRA
jgi:glycerol kinase